MNARQEATLQRPWPLHVIIAASAMTVFRDVTMPRRIVVMLRRIVTMLQHIVTMEACLQRYDIVTSSDLWPVTEHPSPVTGPGHRSPEHQSPDLVTGHRSGLDM